MVLNVMIEFSPGEGEWHGACSYSVALLEST